MAWYTEIVFIIGDLRDAHLINDVNDYFRVQDELGLVSVNDPKLPKLWYSSTGGEIEGMYLGSFKNLNIHTFLDYLKHLAWQSPEDVEMFVGEIGSGGFRIVTLTDPPTEKLA